LNNLFYTNSVLDKILVLEDQEAAHCALVLRKKVGDVIYVIDGKGNRYKCGIDAVSKREVKCSILETESKPQSEHITIAIAPTKNRDRLEWMVEKLVEIGVEAIILMNTKNTERSRTNLERLEKKALSAVKQSLRFYIPEMKEMDFKEVIKLDVAEKYIAHCYEEQSKSSSQSTNKSTTNQLILIGPEGDFTTTEVQQAFDAGFQGLDLGAFRLRTETAAIVAVTKFQ
jgi:16S rRNA (uracil1498-N3)-methyltransferase